MREGQIFSLDAFIAFTLTILLLGTISTTSDSLRDSISSLVSWYERVNIPDNMLDVLLKTPGEPSDWNKNVSKLRSIGLREENSPFISYEKALTFFDLARNNTPIVTEFLKNLSLGKPFCLEFYLGVWNFTVNFAWNPNAGGIAGNFDVYSGSCEITGSETLTFNNPTIIQCSPLDIRGSAFISSDASLCILGSVDTYGSLTTTVGNYPPSLSGTYPYLAINGDWIITGAVTVNVGGDVYINGALIIRGQGSRTINIARDLVIFGDNTNNPYLIDISGAATINIGIPNYLPGNLYLRVGNTWYASNKTGEWYEWTGDSWRRVNEPPVISTTGNFALNIYGYPLTNTWTPPTPPPCFTSGLPLDVFSASISYTYPQALNRSEAWGRITYSGSSFTTALNEIPKNASWIEYASRIVSVDMRKYQTEIEVNSNYTRLISGVLKYTLPLYARFHINVPNETGYALFVIMDGEKAKLLGIVKTDPTSYVQAYLWTNATGDITLRKTYLGNETSVSIPWVDVFSEFSSEAGKPIEMWVYETSFKQPIYIIDDYNIGLLLDHRYELGLVKLWVWDEG
ncbi:hypothetical protein A3L04_07200 [Thermococcus chitonophagus]|uniref:Uncharacterized protein n=1 Tax=Thermococcus chitonophagus TaxID=54262 RepID=A0A160VTD1_9EURY|nr:hypothetical protein [Thermococcus chitonophagus]ASJ16874.1 hypothetical protein A3L04_07200 [Thermococcus chitonophagus]CUX78355.1 hypothetical protein CHITON_1576 [Thermococcus chitonophagus]